VAVTVFLDTSVLLSGLIQFGPSSTSAQNIFHALAEGTLTGAATAWHCCLEFYSVSTRLPPEYRLSPGDAARLLAEEVFARLGVHDLPAGDRARLLRAAVQDGTAGGRIYDTHIAEVARAAGATVIVTDNRRHFLGTLRHGIRVETPADFVASLRSRK
jgi:predicted nucleic acid-binding protein